MTVCMHSSKSVTRTKADEVFRMKIGVFITAILMVYLFSGTSYLHAQNSALEPDRMRSSYIMSPGDDVLIRAREAEEINEKTFKIDGDGMLNLPLVGKVRAAGLTIAALEQELTKKLAVYIRNPQVILTIANFRSDPVFFIGAFQKPGVYPLQGRKTLFEMMTTVGGLQQNANRRIKVTRRKEFGRIPLEQAIDVDANSSAVEITLGSLKQNIDPAEDLVLRPYDVVTAEKAEMIYVTGEVSKVGGYEVGDKDSVTLTQLVTLMGGFTPTAVPDEVKILRPVRNSGRRAEIPVNARSILEGNAPDFPLYPNDIVFVPRSKRNAVWKTLGIVATPLIPTLIWLVVR